MIWFTSDHHFGHTNIIKYSNRPFTSVEEMTSEMINRWNSSVLSTDLVYYIGDFAFLDEAGISNILSKLNGYKILIRGNHDRSKEIMLRAGFNEVHDQLTLEFKKHKVLLHHYPYRPKDPEILKLIKKANKRPIDKGSYLIHGHVHNLYKQKGRMINVSVEMWDYKPANWDEIQELIENGPNNLMVNDKKADDSY